jgi:competence protein ComEA
MQQFIEQVKNYFSISEKEARGFIVLTIIMLLVIFVPFAIKFIPFQQTQVDSPIVINLSEDSDTTSQYNLFPFDPNLISTLEWNKMGVNDALSQRIEKYKTAGGKFKIKSDLRKIYGFPEETYLALHQFILLPDSLVKTEPKKKQKPVVRIKKPSKLININTANETQLETIYGIGPVLSKRILKYRTLLGGFVYKEQLKEVYGLDSLTVEQVIKKTFIAPDFQPLQIKIHNPGLPYHPYLNKDQAKTLVTLFKNKKPLSKEDLLDSEKFSQEDLIRLSPYLLLK